MLWANMGEALRVKMKIKRINKASRALRNKADQRISQLYTNLPCAICGKAWMVSGHHFIPKSRSSFLRHDLRNIVPLCSTHHIWGGEIAAHSQSSLAVHKFVEWFKNKFPDRYEFLVSSQHITQKPDYLAAIEKLNDVTRAQCAEMNK